MSALRYVTLLELDLDSGVQLLSYEGVSSSAGWYKDAVLTIGSIQREVALLSGENRIADTQAVLSNVDRAFSRLKAGDAFRNRTARIKFGTADMDVDEFTTVFTGRVSDWSFSEAKLLLSIRDATFDRFRVKIAGSLDRDQFPYLPAKQKLVLLPIIYGNVSSSGNTGIGAVPLYLVDPAAGQAKYRYLVARHVCKNIDTLYLYGAALPGSSWTAATAIVDGEEMQFVDFDTDQRDTARPEEFEITGDVRGVTDDGTAGGALITNPVDGLKHFVLNYCATTSGEVDDVARVAAAANSDRIGFALAGAILDREQTLADIIARWCESFGISFYVTRLGKFGFYLFHLNDLLELATAPLVTDADDILRNSFKVGAAKELASRIQYNHTYQFTSTYFARQPDHVDAAQELALGQDLRANMNAWFGRDEGGALNAALQRLSYMRENTQLAQFDLPISQYDLDLNGYLRVTHYQGIAADGDGYDQAYSRILALTITPQPKSMKVTAQALVLFEGQAPWRRYFKLGNSATLAASWATASEADREYGYLGSSVTGEFSDGSPAKLLG